MDSQLTEISVSGKRLEVPFTRIDGRTVIATGQWIRTAAIMDEELVEGEPVKDPEAFVSEMKRARFRADIFSFAQKPPDIIPRYNYHYEWDNWAAIPIKSYADWWEARLPQETRRNVRRAAKMGVTTQVVQFDDELVKGILEIYNETPVRQGRRFWHYGKDFETIKEEAATYPDRSDFIGAYFNHRLIGFCKLIYTDDSAHIIYILSKIEHADKRPTNALIAKAVETSLNRGLSYLTYCKYIYGGNDRSALTEFKRRNGFEQLLYPRYFVPLTVKGKIVLALKLHQGLRNRVPRSLRILLLGLRAKFLQIATRNPVRTADSDA